MTLMEALQQVLMNAMGTWLGLPGNMVRAEAYAVNMIESVVAAQEAAAAQQP